MAVLGGKDPLCMNLWKTGLCVLKVRVPHLCRPQKAPLQTSPPHSQILQISVPQKNTTRLNFLFPVSSNCWLQVSGVFVNSLADMGFQELLKGQCWKWNYNWNTNTCTYTVMLNNNMQWMIGSECTQLLLWGLSNQSEGISYLWAPIKIKQD